MVTTEEIYQGSKLARQCENRARVFRWVAWMFVISLCTCTFFLWRSTHHGGHIILQALGVVLSLLFVCLCFYRYYGEQDEVARHRENASTIATELNIFGDASGQPYDARSAAQLWLAQETTKRRAGIFLVLKDFGLVGEKYHGETGSP